MPEFMEFFSIEILSAFLVSDPSLTVPVSADNTSLIIISNSDNPNGRIEFENETYVNTIIVLLLLLLLLLSLLSLCMQVHN